MPSLQHAVAAKVIPIIRRNPPADDVPALRAALVERNRTDDDGPPKGIRRGHEEQISNERGFPVFTLWKPTADGEAARRSVVYLHGGAYVRGIVDWHWRFLVPLADALGARAVLPAYPLAPEFTVEDSFEEMVQLVAEVVAESPGGVVLAGDSAGGGYALAVAAGAARPWRPPGRLPRAARPVGRPHRLGAGHARGRRARPVALLPAPVDLRVVLGRLGGSRPRSPTPG